MIKKRKVILGLSVFALTLLMAFMLPQVVLATGSGKHKKGNGEISDPDVSEAMKQEAAETAQDIHQGAHKAVQETKEATKEAAQKTEEMAEGAAQETAEFFAEAEETLDRATMSLKETLEVEKHIPKAVIDNAAGIAVFPDLTKAGFIAGGRYGRGLLMLNQKNGWNGPVFISLYGASVGAQIGVEQTDLYMVFNNQKAVNELANGDLTLGAETSVAAGTWGNKISANTDADVLVYEKTEGLFAGVSLSGAVIKVDDEANHAYFKGQDDMGRTYYGTEKVLSGEKLIPKTPKADKVIVILSDWK